VGSIHGSVLALGKSSLSSLLLTVVGLVLTVGALVSLSVLVVLALGSLLTLGTALALSKKTGEVLDDLLETQEEEVTVDELTPLNGSGGLGAELLEVLLILGLLHHELTVLLDLVVVDEKRALTEGVAHVEGLLGSRGLIGLLEAHEGVELLLFVLGEHAEALDLTVGGEKSAEGLLGGVLGEVLDVQVASLLGVLVLQGLAGDLDLTILGLEGFLDVKFLSVGHFLAIEVLDGVSGTLGSVFAVVLVLGVVANKGEGTLVVLGNLDGLDAALTFEQSLDFVVGPFLGEVFSVDVVESLAHVTAVLGLVEDTLGDVSVLGFFEGLGGGFGVLEADESVSTGGVVGVERHLEGLDLSVLLELLLELGGGDVGGDLADEDVVLVEFLGVGSEELVVVGEGTARLVVELEVAEGLASLSKFLVIGDGDDSGVERFVEISTNLRLAVKLNVGLVLEVASKLDGGVVLLGEVVDVEVVLFFHFVGCLFLVGTERECFFGFW